MSERAILKTWCARGVLAAGLILGLSADKGTQPESAPDPLRYAIVQLGNTAVHCFTDSNGETQLLRTPQEVIEAVRSDSLQPIGDYYDQSDEMLYVSCSSSIPNLSDNGIHLTFSDGDIIGVPTNGALGWRPETSLGLDD